jgi:predicted nucleic acid-binding protein
MKSMLGEVMELARGEGLSSCDASYLDLAMRLGLPLATKDRALSEAASRCGVKIFRHPA